VGGPLLPLAAGAHHGQAVAAPRVLLQVRPSYGQQRRPPRAGARAVAGTVASRGRHPRTSARPMGLSSPAAGGVELPLGRRARPVGSSSCATGGRELPDSEDATVPPVVCGQ
jgi:hypothetical protein